MGHQVAKSGKAPKQRRARLHGEDRRNVVKNMNMCLVGEPNRTRENLRREAQAFRNNQRRKGSTGYRSLPISAWMRLIGGFEVVT